MAAGVLPFVVRRLLLLPPTVFVVLAITFAFTQAAPGDPVRIISGVRTPPPEVVERIREDFGLTGGYFERFGDYTWGLISRGDLGLSYRFRSPQRTVVDLLEDRIWVSARIGLITLGLTYLIGIPLGLFAALNRGTWKDPFAIGFFLLFSAIPIVVLVPIVMWVLVFFLDDFLAVFGIAVPSVWRGDSVASYIVPVTALTLPSVAGLGRFVRVSALNVITQDYVRTAHAKGLRRRTVIYRHVLRNALLPISTVMGLSFVGVVTGSLFTETIYGVPGVGQFMFESITSRDFNVLLAFTLLISTLFVLANTLIDVLYVFIDPRIRFARSTA